VEKGEEVREQGRD